VVEGSIPNERNKAEGYWASFGHRSGQAGQPILTCDWIDQLAPKAWAVVAAGTWRDLRGIHAMEGNPTGCMGTGRLSLGWNWKSSGGHPDRVRAGLPHPAGQFHGSVALSIAYGGWARRADDSTG